MICRTPEECFRAGWEAASEQEQLTQQEIERIAAMHAPYLTPAAEGTAS